MLRIRLTCLALALAAGTARAGADNAGTTAGNFLSVGTGASVLSMGGAGLGLGADLHAAAWNPAALARVGTTQFALSHAALASQSAQEYVAAGGRLGHGATRWSATALYQGDGSFEGRDAFGGSTGSFNVSSTALGVQLARPFGEAVAAGFGVRWLSDNLGDSRGSGMSIDAGLQARSGAFGFGAAARNYGGRMRYDSGTFDLPAVLGFGASWADETRGLKLAVDADFPRAYYNDVRVGGEWRWQDRVALRAGYRMELGAPTGEPLGGPSFGLGAGANGTWIDYAFLFGDADAQGQHRLGITLRPGFLNAALHPVADAQQGPPAPAATPAPEKPARAARANAEPAPARANAEPAPARANATPDANSAVAIDVSRQLPPGGQEAESSLRSSESANSLAPTRLVKVTPLSKARPSDLDDAVAEGTPAEAKPAKVQAAPAPKPEKAPRPAKLAAPRLTVTPAVPQIPTPDVAPAPIPAVPQPQQETAPVPAQPKPEKPTPARAAVMPVAQLATSSPKVEVVSVPAGAPSTAPISKPSPQSRPTSVIVGDHETLADIARRWDTTAAAIMMENNLVREAVKKGQKLQLPPALRTK